MGLLDLTPEQSAYIGDVGMGLLSASGPSRMPVSLGQALAGGMQMANQNERQRMQDKMAREEFDAQRAYRALQERQLSAALAKQARQDALQQQFIQQFGQMARGAPQVVGQQFNPGRDESNTRFEMGTPNAQADFMKAAQMLATKQQSGQTLTPEETMFLDQVRSRISSVTQNVPDARGMAQMGAAGQMLGIPGAKAAYDYAKDFEKPDWQQVDVGGQIQYVNRNAGQMPTIGKTMSPGETASNQLGWANSAISQQQADIARFNAMKPSYHEGALISPDGQIIKTPMYAPPKGSPEAQSQASAKLIPLLDRADELLKSATGSQAGAAVDVLAGAVGASTKGAQATAQLKALEGAIMMAQPRMEGPQSDKDTMLYRQMAGQVGDNTVPVATRSAALKTIRELHEKYAGGGQTTQIPSMNDIQRAAQEEIRRRAGSR